MCHVLHGAPPSPYLPTVASLRRRLVGTSGCERQHKTCSDVGVAHYISNAVGRPGSVGPATKW